jgi:signal peptidase II
MGGKLFYGLILLFFLVDFFTKRWAEYKLDLGQTTNVIPDWLTWNLVHNKGASFGIFSGYTSALVGIGLMAILFIFYLYRKSETKSFVVQISFALVLGGAIGNIVDRILLGYVIDFIEFRWWPAIFNIADIEIRVGTLLLFYLFLTKRWKF